jgi:ADP-heptose:LPS heptosyltransferase
VEIIEDASVDPLTDLDRFAAQVAAMDVVISIDNSTVHMAGSLGVETWALLPFVPDWRWRGEGEQSFWYASVQLMRQAQIGGFAPLIKAVALKLGRKISATSFSEAG